MVGRFDPAWFSAVMGTAGTAAVLGAGPFDGQLRPAATAFGWTLFAGAAIGLLLLTARFLAAESDDWTDMASPEKGPAYATIPGAMLVLIAALATLVGPMAMTGVWWWLALAWTFAGALLAMVVTVRLFSAAFVHKEFPVEHMSGAWFVPETAVLLSGMVAGRLALTAPAVWVETLVVVAFALVGAGLILFGLTAAVFFTRLILYPHVPAAGAPAMWIMLSPLAISALALHQVGADAALLDGRLGAGVAPFTELVALLLWGFALWWIAAAGAITWRARSAAITHQPADWAYVFPPAALTLATLTFGRVWGATPLSVLGSGFAVVLLGVWLAVVGDTVRNRATARRR
jgi:tellurite resistance protein TehA-like permease